jgi:signal transduction histidine kinase
MRNIVLIFFVFIVTIVNGQNNLDSLLERLSTTKTDSLKEELYYKIIKESFSISVDSGYNQAKKLISVNVEENNLKLVASNVRTLFDLYYQNGDHENLLKLCRQYSAYFKEKDYKIGFFQINFLLAAHFLSLADYKTASKYYTEIINAADEQVDSERAAKSSCYNKRAISHIVEGQYLKATSDLDSALFLVDTADKSSILGIYEGSSQLYMELGEKEKALEYLRRAIRVSDAYGYNMFKIKTRHSMSKFYLKYENYSKSEKYALEGLSFIREGEDYVKLIFSRLLSDIYIKSDQTGKAEIQYKEFIKMAKKLNMKEQIAYAQYISGKIFIHQKDFKNALNECQKSWEYYKDKSTPKPNVFVCECLAESYEGVGAYELALKFYKKQTFYQQEISSTDKVQEALRQNYLLDLKQKEELFKAKRLNSERLNKQKLELKNQLILGISVFSILSIALLFFIAKNRQRKREIINSVDKTRAQEKFSRQLLKHEEDEKVRISRELHDSVGQDLILIKSKAQIDNNKDLENNVSTILNKVREITQGLHPFVLEQFGLTTALKKLITLIDINTDIFITEEIEDIDSLLSKQQELYVYRIVQEILNNIIKHSDSPSAVIIAKKEASSIVLIIKDYGKGFDWNEKSNSENSLGMKTMQERAKILNASLEINSELGKGTNIYLKIPIKNA